MPPLPLPRILFSPSGGIPPSPSVLRAYAPVGASRPAGCVIISLMRAHAQRPHLDKQPLARLHHESELHERGLLRLGQQAAQWDPGPPELQKA